jgi:chromosome segregation ATPase
VAKEGGSGARLKAAQERWQKQINSYKAELPEQKTKAEELDKKSVDAEKESVNVHHKADRFDLGELAVELALILSSIAVLTKRRAYWIGSIVVAVVGGVIAATGFFA